MLSINKFGFLIPFISMLILGCSGLSKDKTDIFNSGMVAEKTSNGFFMYKDGRPAFRYVEGDSSSYYEVYSRSGPVVTVEISNQEDFPVEVGQVIEEDNSFFLVRRNIRGEQTAKVEVAWEFIEEDSKAPVQ